LQIEGAEDRRSCSPRKFFGTDWHKVRWQRLLLIGLIHPGDIVMNSFVAITTAGFVACASVASAYDLKSTQTNARVEKVAVQSKQRLGALTCQVAGGVGLIIGSSKEVNCVFKRSSGPSEHYVGTIGKFGLDIGVTGKSYLTWVVYTVSPSDAKHGALAGNYVGASASASIGLGLGANALIGGNKKNFGLQPLSAETGSGLNVAAGVSSLRLRAAK